MKKGDVKIFYERLAALNPEPKGDLNYTNSYTLLVAVTLSAQATDIGVNKATKKLFDVVNTPEDMLKLGESALKNHIKTIGLYNTKAKNIIALSRLLISRHGGQVPDDQVALEALPGVGRKTANVVRNIAFSAATIAVDTHIFRVGNRTGLAMGKTPLAVERGLLKITPKKFKQNAHHWLIILGRYTCKARKPECINCPVSDLCKFKDKTTN
ncbi:MAG: endonuclease III [Magnetovibrio sp.]|nr:endonuclease III [Magnetovibrio sp.]